MLAVDQESIRQGLRMSLGLNPDVRVVAETDSGRVALHLATALLPDVVIMDVALPELDGLAAAEALHASMPGCQIILLAAHDTADLRRRAQNVGASLVPLHQGLNGLLAALK
jgi:DNA-binding NarL/FixJ family response regulator